MKSTKTKSLLSFILSFAIFISMFSVISVTSFAEASGMCGEKLHWTLDESGILSISGEGNMFDYSSTFSDDGTLVTTAPWKNHAKQIKSVFIDFGATSVGVCAFFGCDCITDIDLPSSIESIGKSAFEECKGIKSIEIPDKVTTISSDMFRSCTSLTDVSISENIENIEYAFENCPMLNYNTFDNAKYLGNSENPYIALILAKDKFITSCKVNDGTKIIGGRAFYDCRELESITFGSNVKVIGQYAFSSCIKMTDVKIPDSVKTIHCNAFEYLRNLKNVFIPDSVESIGLSAFCGCSNLETVTLPFVGGSKTENTFIGYIFGAVSSMENSNYVPASLKTVTVLSGASVIGKRAFDKCKNIKHIQIPDSVTSVGEDAFLYCNSLEYNVFGNAMYIGNNENPYLILMKTVSKNITSCDIHKATKFIYDSAFSSCHNLSSITFGKNIISVGFRSFYNCIGLSKVILQNNKMIVIGYAFSDCPKLKKVVYLGNESQKSKMDIGIFNDNLLNADWVFLGGADLSEFDSPSEKLEFLIQVIFNGFAEESCDVNNNGTVDIIDLVAMKKQLAQFK